MIRYVSWDEGHYSLTEKGKGEPLDLPEETWAHIDRVFAQYNEVHKLITRAAIDQTPLCVGSICERDNQDRCHYCGRDMSKEV